MKCGVDCFSTRTLDPKERAANEFALALLMPEGALNRLIEKERITDIGVLAKRFEVAEVAMRARLIQLGWLSGA